MELAEGLTDIQNLSNENLDWVEKLGIKINSQRENI
jgi:hypothetical protein